MKVIPFGASGMGGRAMLFCNSRFPGANSELFAHTDRFPFESKDLNQIGAPHAA